MDWLTAEHINIGVKELFQPEKESLENYFLNQQWYVDQALRHGLEVNGKDQERRILDAEMKASVYAACRTPQERAECWENLYLSHRDRAEADGNEQEGIKMMIALQQIPMARRRNSG